MLSLSARIVSTVLFLLVIGLQSAQSQVELVITGGIEAGYPIAVVPFGGNSPQPIATIVDSNLAKTGQFETMDSRFFPQNPTQAGDINFQAWQQFAPDYILVGDVVPKGGQFEVRYQLVDSLNQVIVDAGVFPPVNANLLRRVAHKMSDLIMEKVTGVRGAFDTRMAYVSITGSANSRSYKLVISDSDGYSPHSLITSDMPILGPSWSPDGSRLAYAAKKGRNWSINVIDITTGAINKLTDFPQINSSPSWAPDGRSLLITLSKDGSPDIYRISSSGGTPSRITTNGSNDTQACYTAEGQILFSSDRSGRVQIYRTGPSGGGAERISYAGKSSQAAACSPDDAYKVAMVTNMGDGDQAIVYNLYNQEVTTVSDTVWDEAPSWAPNGQMIIYATKRGGRSTLVVASADGLARQFLELSGVEVKDPDWGPYLP